MAKIYYDRQVVLDWFAENGLTAKAEHVFADDEKHAFDFIFENKVALEIEGGIHSFGAHSRPLGILRDMYKYNKAASLGWVVLRCEPKDVCMVDTLDLIKKTIAVRAHVEI